ncbi:MAG: DUF1905 domain-containing protein [Flavihumibacter sp.]|nr:DUF1905 domain-containing protein [Flavihumibacter sp.]
MIKATLTIEKFGQQGEKTGWSYLPISKEMAEKLNPGCRVSFRVKGKLDELAITGQALIPMGEGAFILPLKADIRKKLGKQKGARVHLNLEWDPADPELDPDLLACLEDEPAAYQWFNSLTPGHQRYFSKWISDAKTETTRAKRIAQAVDALVKQWDYGQMIRANKKQLFDK